MQVKSCLHTCQNNQLISSVNSEWQSPCQVTRCSIFAQHQIILFCLFYSSWLLPHLALNLLPAMFKYFARVRKQPERVRRQSKGTNNGAKQVSTGRKDLLVLSRHVLYCIYALTLEDNKNTFWYCAHYFKKEKVWLWSQKWNNAVSIYFQHTVLPNFTVWTHVKGWWQP